MFSFYSFVLFFRPWRWGGRGECVSRRVQVVGTCIRVGFVLSGVSFFWVVKWGVDFRFPLFSFAAFFFLGGGGGFNVVLLVRCNFAAVGGTARKYVLVLKVTSSACTVKRQLGGRKVHVWSC